MRTLQIIDIRAESEDVRSLYLASADDKPLGDFVPGQYVSVAVTDPISGCRQLRQYSLSDAGNENYWRITVKHETPKTDPPAPRGLISSVLHQLRPGDSLSVSAAYGDFCLRQETSNSPLVLISAGVGITPMVSILNHLAAKGSEKSIRFIHAARGINHQILGRDIGKAKERLPNFDSYFFYEYGEADQPNSFVGRMDLTLLDEGLCQPDADYYLCGPVPFMQLQRQYLLASGVDAERVHYEVFGPDLLLGLD